MIAYPCGVCSKSVAKNHKAILCDLCNKWIHLKCNNLGKTDYVIFQDEKNADRQIFCINCISDNVPFSKLNNNKFITSVKKVVIISHDKVIDFIPFDFH